MTAYRHLTVRVARQDLLARRDDGGLDEYPVSTALAGAGQAEGSYQTPLGRHEVRACIGQNAPLG
ncbi:MAG: L,D-transpeptidase, partial [Pseudomonadota bacterium]